MTGASGFDYAAIGRVPLVYLGSALRNEPVPSEVLDVADAAYTWAQGAKQAALLSMSRDSRIEENLVVGGFKGMAPAAQIRLQDVCSRKLAHIGRQPIWANHSTPETIASAEDLRRLTFPARRFTSDSLALRRRRRRLERA